MTPLQVVAAKFLSIHLKQLLQLAREGKLPAYPIGDGQRRLWRFRLSDLAKAMVGTDDSRKEHGHDPQDSSDTLNEEQIFSPMSTAEQLRTSLAWLFTRR
jgi:excisionase family DNA binding protein